MKTRHSVPKALILFALMYFAFEINAQDCTPSALASKPGTLKASRLAGSTSGIAAADLAREKASLLSIHKMIAGLYAPTGVVGDYSTHFDSGYQKPGSVKIADGFGYSMYLLRYNCDKNSADKTKFYVGTDSPTVLRIDANGIANLNLFATDITNNTFRGYLLLKYKPKKINGFYFLGDEFSGDSKTKQKEYTWLITYDDTLPFTYLTRREYLLLSQARLQKSIQETLDYAGFYKEFVDRVNQYLRKPDAELNQPAIINAGDEEKFTGFMEEGSLGSYFAVKHHPGYYRKNLAKSSPQFFTVVFRVWEGDDVPVYVDNMNAIKKAVDFSVLRNMLGK